ncbi:MAG: glycosyltransferase family 2 protein [Candidatus Omnitrophica bacterium]|nr:glycosyltransferase family 2 protein [Candidatus Omnitrophota bacterium]
MKKPYLSVIVPAYNERGTIESLINEVQKVELEKEIIIIDDASSDGTRQLIEKLKGPNIKKIYHEKNQGKGAAIRSALEFIEGEFVIIQDADLEYHPDEYSQLIEPIVKGRADVVFGSRFIGPHRCFLFYHYLGNKVVNLIANLLYNTMLSDFMTCYKVFRSSLIKDIEITANRFGFEAQITGEVFSRNQRVYEVPVSYSGRNYSEGKKIKWTDFFVTVYWLIKTRLKKVKNNA